MPQVTSLTQAGFGPALITTNPSAALPHWARPLPVAVQWTTTGSSLSGPSA